MNSATTQRSELEALFEESPELNINVHDYNINVTANEGVQMSPREVLDSFEDFEGGDQATHLYFHLPLCDYICHFCNYVKTKVRASQRKDQLENWVANLTSEARFFAERFPWVQNAQITSFYIGGGTGALLLNDSRSIGKFVDFVDATYGVEADAERSIEGNPENFTTETVALAKQLGFNRFSVGVQSLQDRVNQFANRGHTREEALRAIGVLLDSGAPFSVDLMFGLPFQTVESVRQDIRLLAKMKVPAITIYRLRNAEREMMGIGNASAWNRPKIREQLDANEALPSVLDTYLMRDAMTEVMIEHGYFPSPCGWWNRPDVYPDGNIPRVSKDKWECYNTMLAHGPGAYGWLAGKNASIVQTHNLTKISEYEAALSERRATGGLAFGRLLEGNRAIGTRLGFGYKANQPIFVDEYTRLYGVNLLQDEPFASVFEALLKKGFMEFSSCKGFLKPTLKGEMVHEEIMYVYFHKAIGGSLPSACSLAP